MHPHSFSETELPIVQRVIHATADFEFQDLIRFSPGAIDSAIRAIHAGRPVFSDVRMIEAGIGKPLMDRFGCRSRCLVSDENVAAIAARTGKTRSETAMRLLGRELDGAAVLIGNAPTALFEVLRLYREEGIRPAVVVGVPVGFVNAAESKAALCGTDLDYITVSGTCRTSRPPRTREQLPPRRSRACDRRRGTVPRSRAPGDSRSTS